MAAEAPRCKLLLVMIDGLGDVCLSALGGRTPLQGGRFVHLDAVASECEVRATQRGEGSTHCGRPRAEHGLCGLMDSVEPGLACGSDTAHLSIFGYSPRHFYRGRGAFESMGAGLHMVCLSTCVRLWRALGGASFLRPPLNAGGGRHCIQEQLCHA
jgi:2,3-bisphosphoglycerate-independent phosphoglycerate mutase